jgi:hypothetical protein
MRAVHACVSAYYYVDACRAARAALGWQHSSKEKAAHALRQLRVLGGLALQHAYSKRDLLEKW